MQPTVADLVAQIGEQAVELRMLRKQLAAEQAKVGRLEGQVKIVSAALAAKDQAAGGTQSEPENSP